jgi:hypothetical protein
VHERVAYRALHVLFIFFFDPYGIAFSNILRKQV